MRRYLILGLPLLASAFAAVAFDNGAKALPATGTIQVAFPPEDDANGLIVGALREARTSVRVQAFGFTSNEIAFALIAAKRRGVDVRVIADAEQARKLENHKLGLLQQNGIRIWLDEQHQSAHNKVMLIDGESATPTLLTGSMNFTYSGQFKNAENLLVLRGNKALADAYGTNWQRHFNHAAPYRP
jgi:phosphatidylserine/phosphatidylglycerophosphate/cardiolipin synthase-like enzyme